MKLAHSYTLLSFFSLIMIFNSFILPGAFSLKLDIDDDDSVCTAAAIAADGLLDYHDKNGLFHTVYWWQSGVALGSLLNFQHLCDNDTYQDVVYEGLLAQAGDKHDYQPSSQDGQIGNDDIGAWALTVIHAAELDFKNPQDGSPSWIQRAKNAFELLYSRWDEDHCEGGLRWQFNDKRTGYEYKATIANANLFQLAARLAKYYEDDSEAKKTYLEAAESIYEWLEGVGLINELEFGTEVYDGSSDTDNCTEITKVLWSYNYGTLLAGTAYLYELTEQDTWKDRTESIILGSQILYNNTVLYERACETYDICNTDQRIFKGIYTRFLGLTAQIIPSLQSKIQSLIEPSAKAAAESCSGGSDGVTCGQNWGFGGWDGYYSASEQVDALEIFINLLV